jgi:hypothetical protein
MNQFSSVNTISDSQKKQRRAPSTVNSSPTRGTHSLKARLYENPRWANLILHGINGDRMMRPWKLKGKAKNNHVQIVMVFIY